MIARTMATPARHTLHRGVLTNRWSQPLAGVLKGWRMNGANGMSDIEGKTAQVAAKECGNE
jgi:hypothetical protein